MKKIAIFLTTLIIIITLSFTVSKYTLTGAVIQNYSYTKAICNSTNYCQDYKITCDKQNATIIQPIINATVQHPKNWQDPRGNQTKEKLC